jgi:anthranilate synthase component 1
MSVVLGDYTPALRELQSANLDGNSVAISREILADLDTPVSAYLKLRNAPAESPASGAGNPRCSFLLESAEGGERIGRYSFVGATPRRVLRVKDGRQWVEGLTIGRSREGGDTPCPDPLAAVRALVEAYRPALRTARSPFEGGALGYLSYEAGRYFERLPSAARDPLDFPDATFQDVDTVLVFDHIARRARVVSHAWIVDPDGARSSVQDAYARATERIDAVVARLDAPVPTAPSIPVGPQSFSTNMGREHYEDMVARGKEHILAGDILQVVLSQRLTIPLAGDAFGLYRRLRTVSPSPYMYFLDFGDHQVIGASPELLVQIKDGVVFTRPIAGTRPRGASPDADDALAADLLADEKERAEHLMLVDLARNDVGRVSYPGSVEVNHFMEVERFSHVMHLVSDVSGRLSARCTPYDALRAAFPAGTVSGAPKIRAMQIIADLEPDCRGPYAGAVGFINTLGDMEMAITIRTGVARDESLELQVGAGIVADSVPEREYMETINKARALLEAAGVKV